MAADESVRVTGERVEALLAEFAAAGPADRERAEDLVRLLAELYGAGLARIVALAGQEAVARLTEDELVSGLLILHDLHPLDTEARVTRALDTVRPYLGSHAGDVTLLGIGEDMVLRLRLEGTCDGCPASMVTVKTSIESAVMRAAPEIVAVDVEGVAEPHAGPGHGSGVGSGAAEPGFIPVDAVRVCPAPAGTGAERP